MGEGSVRRRILERRALFIGSAIAGLGCGPSAAPPAAPPTVVGVPPAPSSSAPAAEAPRPEPAPTAKPEQPPAIAIPQGVSERARQSYDKLARTMQEVHKLLGEAESRLDDSCDIQDPACEAKWREVASRFNDLRRVHTFSYFCPGSSAEAKQFAAVHTEQRDYEQDRTKKLETRIAQALERGGPAAKQRWEDLKREAYEAKPYPCLSIGCNDW